MKNDFSQSHRLPQNHLKDFIHSSYFLMCHGYIITTVDQIEHSVTSKDKGTLNIMCPMLCRQRRFCLFPLACIQG